MRTEAKSNMADLLSVGSFLKKKEEGVYFLYINKSVFFFFLFFFFLRKLILRKQLKLFLFKNQSAEGLGIIRGNEVGESE